MIKIHQEVYGQGKPIVLIHGWAMHSGIWRLFAQQLAKNNKVICLDMPGHGHSESVEPYSLETISEALIEAIDEPSFCLLGWSLGASVAVTMTKMYPDRVDSLICLAANPKFVQTKEWPGMRSELLDEFAQNLKLSCQLTLLRFLALQVFNLPDGKQLLKTLKLAIYECEAPTERVLINALGILKTADLRDDISKIKCPLMIIQGDKDTLIPVKTGSAMQKIQQNSELRIIVGAGHVPFLSHASLLINLINEFG